MDVQGQYIPVRNPTFGATIFDKAEVEDRVRRAQRAILNPGVEDLNVFLTEDIDDHGVSEIDFSSNRVSIEISGPNLTDLSFIDLPGKRSLRVRSSHVSKISTGLIQTAGSRGRETDIELVESLVTSYIGKSNCLILLTVTCESAFSSS